MSEARKTYNPNKEGCLNVRKMAEEFLYTLQSAQSSVTDGLRKNLEIEFSEIDENRFIDLMELDEWEVKDMLELSSMFFAIAVLHSYEEKYGEKK